jgi:predicted amidohydrolase YtcJ
MDIDESSILYFVRTLGASLVCMAMATTALAQEVADRIWTGGPVLTMAGVSPSYAEAVAVKNGRIIAVGSDEDVMKTRGGATEVVDLAGSTLLPGFIDSHSHFLQTAVKLSTVNLDPPPAGNTKAIKDIQDALRIELEANPRGADDWLWGWGYDNGFLAEKRHPTREDLDAVSTKVPIGLYHFSSHTMAVNSRALELVGYNAQTKAPEGGVILREAESEEPNGVLEETAMLPFLQILLGSLDNARLFEMLDLAQEEYIRSGFTTITEMAGIPDNIKSLRTYARDGKLKVDLMVGALIIASSAAKIVEDYTTDYFDRLRIGGGKINLDGGSPGRTAYLREPYYTQAEGVAPEYRGYSSIEKQEDMNALVRPFYKNRVPIFIHALGDAAVDQAIAAVRDATSVHPYDDPRTQLIHLQMFQPDQMDALKNLGVTTTFQITHNFYFADFHNESIYGPQRTKRLNPMRSALDAGFSVTLHHDSPVHPVSQTDLIWIATNRTGRSGTVYGPEERISVYDALRGSTIEAAYQFFEDDLKGSVEVGKLADFVILDKDPLTLPAAELRDLRVMATIKEGSDIYRAESQ